MIRRRISTLLVVASVLTGLLWFGGAPSTVRASHCGAGNVSFYEHTYQDGIAFHQCELTHITNFSNVSCGFLCNWNDKVSSLVANVSCQSGTTNCNGARMFKDSGYAPTSPVLTYGCSGWQQVNVMPSGWNDAISSMKWIGYC